MSTTSSPWVWYDNAPKFLSFPGLLTDDIKVALLASGYVFSAAHQYYDVSITNELSTANGYTLGGQSLTTKSLAAGASSGDWKFLSDNPVWTATGGNIVARSFIVYNNTPSSNKPLLGFAPLDYNGGSPLNVTAIATFNLSIIVPTTGWFASQKVNG